MVNDYSRILTNKFRPKNVGTPWCMDDFKKSFLALRKDPEKLKKDIEELKRMAISIDDSHFFLVDTISRNLGIGRLEWE